MKILDCYLEWMEAANRSGRTNRNGRAGRVVELQLEPPTPKDLEDKMRKDSEQYIQFVSRMLPPVCGKEAWNEVAEKTKFSTFVTASQEAFALLLYRNGYENGCGCSLILPPPRMVMRQGQ